MVSCKYDDIAPNPLAKQISQPLLVGSWKMVTNNGVDVSFDIVESSGLTWTKRTILTYKGRTTVFNEDDSAMLSPIYQAALKSQAGAFDLQLWADPKYNSDLSDLVVFNGLQPNSNYSQLTGKLGQARVWGLDTTYSGPPLLDTVNFKSLIIINRVK